MKKATRKPATVLVLRTCNSDMTSSHGFRWPVKGKVSAPDWNKEPVCGGGLHGLLRGFGDGNLLDWSPSAKWVVVRVAERDIVKIDDKKVKFRAGIVVYCGDRAGAVELMRKHQLDPATAGVSGTATAGDSGTATAGVSGTATAGYSGTATAGEDGVFSIQWYDSKRSRYRVSIAVVGENGIKPNVKYRVDENGVFVEVAE